jgi:hypothetical protein
MKLSISEARKRLSRKEPFIFRVYTSSSRPFDSLNVRRALSMGGDFNDGALTTQGVILVRKVKDNIFHVFRFTSRLSKFRGPPSSLL